MSKITISGFAAGLAMAVTAATAATIAQSTELPADDPGLFSYLFSQKTIPADWIFAPASDELTPAMMQEIAERLSAEGGKYEESTKTARGWVLDFQKGTARARIIRAPDHKIIGVFFSGLE